MKTSISQKRLHLYHIDIKYIRDLSHIDDHVMSVSPQIGKSTRPFIGIIVICGEKQYCVPLSSPKPKHSKMKNDIDFIKITDNDKLIGVLNFNNMIPVDERFIIPCDLKIRTNDNEQTKYYKKLITKQLSFCQRNHKTIENRANKLYEMITTGKANHLLCERCCDFKKLEAYLLKK